MIDKEVQGFLWGVRLNNNKEWFEKNKPFYTEKVYRPMKALSEELWALMEEKYALGTQPRVSRIYRDARRLHGRGPYKDHLWLSLRLGAEDWTGAPTWYFEICPEEWSYGMVCAFGRADFMRAFRAAVKAEPARFDALAGGLERRGVFALWGDEYKRPPEPAPTELSEPWFRKKFICFSRSEQWNDRVSSPELAKLLARDMGREIEMYKFFARIAQSINEA